MAYDPPRDEQIEELDALPVLTGSGALATPPDAPDVPRTRGGSRVVGPVASGPVAVQAAAVAATSFVAGAAAAAVLRRRRARRSLRGARRIKHGRGAELVQVVGSRSFLVDVHLLGSRD